ncbi:putative Phosphomevalonate kinase [Hypsibius exemplaris]|uniref:Phosphomevalonate kinase n=1 Tax=Hypsibius exemplaris TaxID=2072580 RepID=A0A1W0WGV5_HYPEX|nr:putative Phosphomevalonate kinase [Hypsibius exemplaris]
MTTEQDHSTNPQVVLILSGKRKSGKDFIASKLLLKFGEEIATIIRLSGPLKSEYAKAHSLDFDHLLSAEAYKEQHRGAMITWGEEKRQQDPSHWCRLATAGQWVASKKVWIVSDARRPSDLVHFKVYPHVIRIRVECDEPTRRKRGYVFTKGIDDSDSECGLDGVTDWDYVLNNSSDRDAEKEIEKLIAFVDEKADSIGDADVA